MELEDRKAIVNAIDRNTAEVAKQNELFHQIASALFQIAEGDQEDIPTNPTYL